MSTHAETSESRAVTTILHALEQARQGRNVDRRVIEGFVADLTAAIAGRLSQPVARAKRKSEADSPA
jgi:hypothetical protein